jgi:hypothetical protein
LCYFTLRIHDNFLDVKSPFHPIVTSLWQLLLGKRIHDNAFKIVFDIPAFFVGRFLLGRWPRTLPFGEFQEDHSLLMWERYAEGFLALVVCCCRLIGFLEHFVVVVV